MMDDKINGFKKYFLIFVLGGSIGNLFDRIYYSAVPDFIDFHIKIFTGLFLMLQIYLLHWVLFALFWLKYLLIIK